MMEWNDIAAVKGILLFVFAGLNVALNIGMLYYLQKAWSELRSQTNTNTMFAEVFSRMDKIASENTEGLFSIIQDRSDNLIARLEDIHRRQNTTAKMIYDDRERLRQHVENVSELQRIAKALEAKFLAQEERGRGG